MIGLISLFIFLILCFGICIIGTKRNIISPQICFVGSFIPQVFYAFFWQKKWDINPTFNTVIAIDIGLLVYIIVSAFYTLIDNRPQKLKKTKYRIKKNEKYYGIDQIASWKLWLFIIFQFSVLVLASRSLIIVTGASSLAEASSKYNFNNKYGAELYHIPTIIGQCRHLCEASGCIWSYYLATSLVYKKKKNRLPVMINYIISILNALILGQRLGIVRMLIALLFEVYLVYGFKNNWSWKVKWSTIFKIILVVLLIPVVLYYSLLLMGRRTEANILEYLAIYISAEIKIFDTFIRSGQYGRPFFKSQTCGALLRSLSRIFVIDGLSNRDYYPFLVINGVNIGNASTIFYNYYYDGGFWGIIFFTAFFAWISQICFSRALKEDNGHAKLSVLTYGYVLFCIVFSFFDDFFYKYIITLTFIRTVIFWIIIIWFIEKLNVRVKK